MEHMPGWIDTHCHLDAAEFDPDRQAVRARARAAGVLHCVLPAVAVANFEAVRTLAHADGDSYCLGIHPLYTRYAAVEHLQTLQQALAAHCADARLVAVGEVGLDYFVPELLQTPLRERQEDFFDAQVQLAQHFGLPLVLHVRRSVDRVLQALRQVARTGHRWSGIAHAFNGSAVQAQEFIKLGFKLGFGGAVTFERASRLRYLAQSLPLDAIVLETDAPDIPPQWRYVNAQERNQGSMQGRNEPTELPHIATVVAGLRGMTVEALAKATCENACQALPRLGALLA